MEPHDSVPYNPDIAGVFYRAGYIERWGQGIEKNCDSCRKLGAELPKYELCGHGLRICFPALKDAVIDDAKTPKSQNAKVPKRQSTKTPKRQNEKTSENQGVEGLEGRNSKASKH